MRGVVGNQGMRSLRGSTCEDGPQQAVGLRADGLLTGRETVVPAIHRIGRDQVERLVAEGRIDVGFQDHSVLLARGRAELAAPSPAVLQPLLPYSRRVGTSRRNAARAAAAGAQTSIWISARRADSRRRRRRGRRTSSGPGRGVRPGRCTPPDSDRNRASRCGRIRAGWATAPEPSCIASWFPGKHAGNKDVQRRHYLSPSVASFLAPNMPSDLRVYL